MYREAHAEVTDVLHAGDLGRWVLRSKVAGVLRSRWSHPVARALEELHERAAELASHYGLDPDAIPALGERELHPVTVEVPDEFGDYERSETTSGIMVMRNRPLSDFVVPHWQFFTRQSAA